METLGSCAGPRASAQEASLHQGASLLEPATSRIVHCRCILHVSYFEIVSWHSMETIRALLQHIVGVRVDVYISNRQRYDIDCPRHSCADFAQTGTECLLCITME